PVAVGRRVDEIPAVLEAMEGVVARGRFAKAALEIAMFDAWARSLDVPVRSLLGGAARDSIECTWALGAMPLDELRSEEHTSELQSRFDLVCRLLLEKKYKHTSPPR